MTTSLTIFEKIKKTNESNSEYWSARDLAKTLDYAEYRNFISVVEKAQKSCKNSGQSIKNHFVHINNMVEIGSSASRQVSDILLTRYACYLIMQNADPAKEIVAIGQTYFALQTRRQELQNQQIEDTSRLSLRNEITVRNKHLAQTASKAGINNFAIFTNHGYKGLYGGLNMQKIHEKKKLKKHQHILDHMGGEELGANIFRATQAEARLRRESVQGEAKANQVHFEVGKKVRQTIKELGGEMPENLPVVDNIAKVKRRLKKENSAVIEIP